MSIGDTDSRMDIALCSSGSRMSILRLRLPPIPFEMNPDAAVFLPSLESSGAHIASCSAAVAGIAFAQQTYEHRPPVFSTDAPPPKRLRGDLASKSIEELKQIAVEVNAESLQEQNILHLKLFEESLAEVLHNTFAQMRPLLQSRLSALSDEDFQYIKALIVDGAATLSRPGVPCDTELQEIWRRFDDNFKELWDDLTKADKHDGG